MLAAVGLAGALVLLVVMSLIAAGAPGDEVTGSRETLLFVLLGVLLLLVAAVPLGFLVAVVGAVRLSMTRDERVAEQRRALSWARETARTPAEVHAVQAAVVPGRGWRRMLPLLVLLVPLVLLWLADRLGQGWLGPLVMVGAFAAVAVWLTRWQQRSNRLRERLRAQLTRSPGEGDPFDDDSLALSRRTDAVQGWATERGLVFRGDVPAPQRTVMRFTHYRNAVTGTVDGRPFLLGDEIATTSQQPGWSTRGNPPPGVWLQDAATVVRLPFPAVVRLAVVAQRAAAPLLWSHVGPQVSLESAEFNRRFDVYCDDPIRVRLVLNPSVMAALLQWQPETLQVLLESGDLVVRVPDALVEVDRLDDLLALAAKLHFSARSAVADITPA